MIGLDVVIERQCAQCGSGDTMFVQRGLAGATDERDQYVACNACGRLTYEIVSRTQREIRIGRLEAGRTVRLGDFTYTVSRVLKVGLNECLVYVKPSPDQDSVITHLRQGRR